MFYYQAIKKTAKQQQANSKNREKKVSYCILLHTTFSCCYYINPGIGSNELMKLCCEDKRPTDQQEHKEVKSCITIHGFLTADTFKFKTAKDVIKGFLYILLSKIVTIC